MKKTNKGFSLVELIIVIAIMAILAGAIAPALIRYIDKSRKSNDVTAAKDIKTAVESALGNELIYEYATSAKAGDGTYTSVLLIHGGEKLPSSGAPTTATDLYKECVESCTLGEWTDPELDAGKDDNKIDLARNLYEKEVATSIGEKMPKPKYKKNAQTPKDDDSDNRPAIFVACVSAGGAVEVYVVSKSVEASLTPKDGANFTGCAVKPGETKFAGAAEIGDEDGGDCPATATKYMLVPDVSSYYQ